MKYFALSLNNEPSNERSMNVMVIEPSTLVSRYMNRVMQLMLFLAVGVELQSQTDIPTTQLFLVDVHRHDSSYHWSEPQNITPVPGYNNQPSFSPDGSTILFSSIRGDKQADIYSYHIASKKTTRLTTTKESEFAPTFVPGSQSFSVVRVERNKKQRVWKFSPDGTKAECVTDKLDSVGYHIWYDEKTLALYMITQAPVLQTVNLGTGRVKFISDIAGRCFHMIPHEKSLSFVGKSSDTSWTIRKVSEYYEISILAPTLRGIEDFIWTPHGSLLMARGTQLFEYDPARDAEWREVANFHVGGISGFYRLAMSATGDKLVLVSYTGKRP